MLVHRAISKLPSFNKAVITIGTFDGVHQGHRKIISRLKSEAKEINGETVIITFHPHPRKIVSSAILGVRLINTLDEKIELLEKEGIHHLVVVPFTEAFANLTADEYMESFLYKQFKPHTIIIGYDHRFGRGREGDYRLMEKLASKYNYELKEIPKHEIDEIGISSTRIREALLESKIEIANKLLGYDFFFSGEIVHGDKLGRKLGYPTANLHIIDEEKIIPGNGIYAVRAGLNNGKDLNGMMSIGFRPTVDGTKRVIEVNLFDFEQEVYGQTLRVQMVKYLRSEIKFDSLDALVAKMDNDKVETMKALGINS